MLVLTVGQRHRRRDGDRVAGVDAHRVEVLDRADDDDVVGLVAHHLQLVLLPPDDRLLDEDLGRRAGVEAGAGDAGQVLVVVGDAGAGAAHRERRAHDDGIAELADRLLAVLERCGRRSCVATSPPTFATIALNCSRFSPRWIASKLAPIISTPYFSSTPFSCSAIAVLRAVWPPSVGSRASRALLGDHLLDELRGDRLDVGRVGELRVGHDRRRVGVDQDDPDALGLEHPAGLGAGVVELAGLADDDRPGADHQDGLDVVALRHQAVTLHQVARTGRTGRRRRAVRRRPRGGTGPRRPSARRRRTAARDPRPRRR